MRRMMALTALALAGFVWLSSQTARAEVKPNGLIAENMVLQRGIKVPLWGTAEAGEKVSVRFEKQEVSTTADKDGKWKVELSPLKAGGPFEMTIAGSNTLTFKNVLVGEVWIASGQSNMEMKLSDCTDADKHKADSKNPMVRLYTVPKRTADKPLEDVGGKWVECGPDTVGNFSGVAYFFGRDLQKALDVPVGLIHTSWGGTRAEAWTSTPVLESQAEFKGDVENYRKRMEEYQKTSKGNDPSKDANAPSVLYNGMIAPLVPYGVKGAIWYQGESNAGKYAQYEQLLSSMIKNWRDDWKTSDFPFLIVQLAPFTKIEDHPVDTDWARLREAQRNVTLHVPKTAEAVITDVGDEKDIHPKRKEAVGARLALAAEALAYGKDVEYSGPEFKSLTVEGNKAVLQFTHVGGGLEAKGDSQVTGFTIAGEDKVFYPATAVIKGDTVVLTSDKVTVPVAVRFGWANYPVVNLWNKAGLPASPFRTDDWAKSK